MYVLDSIDTFGTTGTLAKQLADLVTARTATKECSMTYNFVDKETVANDCGSPNMNPNTFKPELCSYSTSAWTIGIASAMTFATEAEQATSKTDTTTALTKLGVVATVLTAAGTEYIAQDNSLSATLVVPASTGASAFAAAGATLALLAIAF